MTRLDTSQFAVTDSIVVKAAVPAY